MRVRDNWPSLAFAVAIVVAGIINVLPFGSFPDLCEPKEKETAVVCFRNWANAAGNLFTFGIASAAALFAFGQWRAAKNAAEVASLDALRERIQRLRDVRRELTSSSLAIYNLEYRLDEITRMISGKDDYSFSVFKGCLEAITENKEQLFGIGERLGEAMVATDDPVLEALISDGRAANLDAHIEVNHFTSRVVPFEYEDGATFEPEALDNMVFHHLDDVRRDDRLVMGLLENNKRLLGARRRLSAIREALDAAHEKVARRRHEIISRMSA